MVERRNVSGLAVPAGYSHVTIAPEGRLVMIAGAVPLDENGHLVGRDDYSAHAQQVLANLVAALEAAGATGDDVLKRTVYVVSVNRDDLVVVWRAVQQSPVAAAASTPLGVALLGYEGQLVEIEATAVVS